MFFLLEAADVKIVFELPLKKKKKKSRNLFKPEYECKTCKK